MDCFVPRNDDGDRLTLNSQPRHCEKLRSEAIHDADHEDTANGFYNGLPLMKFAIKVFR